jgi:hypothetical protein
MCIVIVKYVKLRLQITSDPVRNEIWWLWVEEGVESKYAIMIEEIQVNIQ